MNIFPILNRRMGLVIACVGASALCAPASADRMRPSADYGMAGCGLGTYLFKENDKSQILAATTNTTFGSQTFGITFGTSNCGRSAKMVSADYIAVNEDAIRKDAARGSGESLAVLAHILGCPAERFAPTLRARYLEVFGVETEGAAAVADRIHRVIAEDAELSRACASLS